MSTVIDYHLAHLSHHYQQILADFASNQAIFRLWAQDRALFTTSDEVMMDWLSGPSDARELLPKLSAIQAQVAKKNFSSVVLLGMGGSSLAPLVFKTILAPHGKGFFVLDTIHPRSVKNLEQSIDIKTTLFIVASKSGTTLESNLLYRYFLQRLMDLGVPDTYSHFMAITDPTTPLEQESVECGFLPGPFGRPGIGGRYSVFSAFGMMPALLMGLDTARIVASAQTMMNSCGASIAPEHNPGARLGAFLALCAMQENDRLIIHLSPSLSTLGLWLEQLIAESLGKKGKGLLPILTHGQALNFHNSSHLTIQLEGDGIVDNASFASHGAATITIGDPHDIAAVMYCFKIGVALAGAAIGLNPFDQPDVEKSKKHTTAMIKNLSIDSSASLPPQALTRASNSKTLADFLGSVGINDYIAILSYLDDNEHSNNSLALLVDMISKKTSVPVLQQIGPRYLHSTGQLFKGGKNNGHFIFITGPYEHDITNNDGIKFSDIHLSQAQGDMWALRESARPIFHLHLEKEEDLLQLCQAIEAKDF